MWNKGAEGVKNAIADIERGLPFSLKSLHSDNGSEFIAQPLYDYLLRRDSKVNWTRSRPRRSNDNCHVEQKNWTHVRETFGYERYNKAEYVIEMNDIYMCEQYHLYNFFIPTMKLKNKTRIGSRYKRQYSKPQTPYERLIESEALTQEQKDKLIRVYESLNPFELKAELKNKLNKLHEKLSEDKPSVKTNKVAL